MDPYLIPDTDILKNKLGITDDKNELEQAELDLVHQAFETVESVKGNFDVVHLQKIHEHLFEDVYEWSGDFRTIDTEKAESVLGGMSVPYEFHGNIQMALDQAIDKMMNENWEDKPLDERANEFSKHFAEIWRIHPFREGNTRTVTHFCVKLAEEKGVAIDEKTFADNPQFTRDSLVLASLGEYAEYEHLNKIVKGAMVEGEKQIEKPKSFSLNAVKEKHQEIEKQKNQNQNKNKENDQSL